MIDFFYDMIYMMPMSLLATLLLGSFFGMPQSSVLGSMISVLFTTWIIWMRHAGKKERYLIFGVLVVFFVCFLWIIGGEKRAYLWSEYRWLLWILGLSLLAMMIGFFAKKIIWVRWIVASVLIGIAIYDMVNRKEISKLGSVLIFLMIMIYLVENIQRNWKKSGYTSIKSHVVMITPALILLCALVLATPAPSKPYDWNFAITLWKRTVLECKKITGILTHGTDEYGSIGFSDNSVFEGALGTNEKPVFRVQMDGKNEKVLYLAGKVSDVFEENSWKSNLSTENHDRMFDLLETKCAIAKYGYKREDEFISENSIHLENYLYNTRHIFTPNKVYLESPKTTLPQHTEKNDSILTKKTLRYSAEYDLAYYTLNYTNPEFVTLLETSSGITEEEWKDMLKRMSIKDKNIFSYEEYENYRDRIYTNYCPEVEVSQEIENLLEEQIGAEDSQYEKVKAIEKYLQGFAYNTAPGVLPSYVKDEESFLDYFLLDSKEGYCIHYATAFVLLARECGFPARYVQGYYVEKGKGNTALVTQKQAHAWAEVYFDHVGWIIFEPTPGYSVANGWSVGGTSVGNAILQYQPNIPHNEHRMEALDEIPQEKQSVIIDLKLVMIPLLVAVIFLVCYLLVAVVLANKRYEHLQNNKKLEWMTTKNLKILRLLGFPIGESETFSEYKKRILEGLEGAVSEEELQFLGYYEEILYADKVVGETAVKEVEQSFYFLKKQLRKRKPRYRFLIV